MANVTQYHIRTLSLAVAVGLIWSAGCSTTTTGLRISSPERTEFTAQYRAGSLSGSVTTVTEPGKPSTVLEVSGPGFTCDIAKKDRAARLSAEVLQGGACVYRAEAPEGSAGVRISRKGGAWRQETY